MSAESQNLLLPALGFAGILMLALLGFLALRFMVIYERGQMAKIEREKITAHVQHRELKPIESEQEMNEKAGLESGGYIIFEMPEAKKSVFHDLLKGFEDYAKIRGYAISFSIDNSFPNKTAFKFTFETDGFNVSSSQIKQDLKNYINKVQKG